MDVKPTIWIDVWWPRHHVDELHVEHQGRLYRFVFDAALKRGRSFHAGLFVDEAAVAGLAAYRYPSRRRFALLIETPMKSFYSRVPATAGRYECVLTYDEALVSQGPPYRLTYFGTSWVNGVPPPGAARKTKNVSFIGNIEHRDEGGYALRKTVARLCMADARVECFGKGIRPVAGKAEALAEFRFSIAMENACRKWYFTEKLIDCLMMECVPVYWGCPPVPALFDERGIIRFETADQLGELLAALTPDRYEAMRPYVLANRQQVIDQRLDGSKGLFGRVAQVLLEFIDDGGALSGARRTEAMAAMRWLRECGGRAKGMAPS